MLFTAWGLNEIKNRHTYVPLIPGPSHFTRMSPSTTSVTSFRAENGAHWLSRHFSNYDKITMSTYFCVFVGTALHYEFGVGLVSELVWSILSICASCAFILYSVITCWKRLTPLSLSLLYSRLESSLPACCVCDFVFFFGFFWDACVGFKSCYCICRLEKFTYLLH